MEEQNLNEPQQKEKETATEGIGEHKKKKKENYLEGIFLANAKGFGFVSVEGWEQDFYIPEDSTGTAMDRDVVLIRLMGTARSESSGFHAKAEVVRILTRAVTKIVGTFYGRRGSGYVIPDNRKITTDVRIPEQSTLGAVNGHKVVVRITDYGESSAAKGKYYGNHGGAKLTGDVVEILGHMDDPGVDILSIIRAYNLPGAFPQEVREQVQKIPQTITPTQNTMKGREDWRDVLTVTIDGPDTKDIDDAISIRPLKEEDAAWELGVHIADVAQYVGEDSPLDKEALKRATSNYLVDRVIPMLPHELSNGICSLNPGEDRYALSCIMKLDKKGNVVDTRVTETLIRSDAKLSYPGVMKLFTDKDESEILGQLQKQGMQRGAKTKAHAIAVMLRRGKKLSSVLSKKRIEEGAIDFEFPECRIYLNEEGKVQDIVPCKRNEATIMIENFMVAANAQVAQMFYWLDIPFVYRTHAKPMEEKMIRLRAFVQGYGCTFVSKNGDVHPKELQTLLAGLKGRPEEATISMQTLRSLERAEYTTDCGGHFGLALTYYCHFTSPIRRYPDLQIHRIIKEYLHGKLDEKRRAHYNEILPGVCAQCSEMERRADESERETDKQKMCEYMKEKQGEVFEGVVSGVTGWGIYVQLPNTVEGMVALRSLRDDYYEYDAASGRLVGEKTGKVYYLGQKVMVCTVSVDTAARTIDFELVRVEDEVPKEGSQIEKSPRPDHKSGQKNHNHH